MLKVDVVGRVEAASSSPPLPTSPSKTHLPPLRLPVNDVLQEPLTSSAFDHEMLRSPSQSERHLRLRFEPLVRNQTGLRQSPSTTVLVPSASRAELNRLLLEEQHAAATPNNMDMSAPATDEGSPVGLFRVSPSRPNLLQSLNVGTIEEPLLDDAARRHEPPATNEINDDEARVRNTVRLRRLSQSPSTVVLVSSASRADLNQLLDQHTRHDSVLNQTMTPNDHDAKRPHEEGVLQSSPSRQKLSPTRPSSRAHLSQDEPKSASLDRSSRHLRMANYASQSSVDPTSRQSTVMVHPLDHRVNDATHDDDGVSRDVCSYVQLLPSPSKTSLLDSSDTTSVALQEPLLPPITIRHSEHATGPMASTEWLCRCHMQPPTTHSVAGRTDDSMADVRSSSLFTPVASQAELIRQFLMDQHHGNTMHGDDLDDADDGDQSNHPVGVVRISPSRPSLSSQRSSTTLDSSLTSKFPARRSSTSRSRQNLEPGQLLMSRTPSQSRRSLRSSGSEALRSSEASLRHQITPSCSQSSELSHSSSQSASSRQSLMSHCEDRNSDEMDRDSSGSLSPPTSEMTSSTSGDPLQAMQNDVAHGSLQVPLLPTTASDVPTNDPTTEPKAPLHRSPSNSERHLRLHFDAPRRSSTSVHGFPRL
ncbi:Aste57867_23278 [Aphanomyces stellatus]|uniref:Aste57867_23278 protein n=1 Tax=Aphanomyces stellatus TaxID=120398 RepID=A0A485LMA3_9STRA|nr:hypothetical protein As57867_023207 [Aphanomyces stellatus]VFT99923.1 Aste57867_23278 [Aphanomyces stellatus]